MPIGPTTMVVEETEGSGKLREECVLEVETEVEDV